MLSFSAYLDHLRLLLLVPDRIPLAMAALLLAVIAGLVCGPFFGNAAPFFWIVVEKLLGGIGRKLDRVNRRPGDLMFRGFFLTLIGLCLFYAAGECAGHLAKRYPLHGFTEIALLSLILSAGAVWNAILRLLSAMNRKKAGKNAYYIIARTSRTDLSTADDFTLTRVGMGLVARLFDKGIVAPLFWYFICGLQAAYLYAGIAALAWRFGRDGFTKGFGQLPLLLEHILGFIPNLISGLLMALGGILTPTGGITRGLTGLFRAEGHAPYLQGGAPVTAMAYALKVGLGGPITDIDGSAIRRVWAGPEGATAKLNPGHLRRALYITLMAHLLLLTLMGASLLFSPQVVLDMKSMFGQPLAMIAQVNK